MAVQTRKLAEDLIDAHEASIDALHERLAAMPNVDKAKLQKAIDDHKAAHKQFHDDALGCMN